MKIKDNLMDSRAGRSMLASFGLAKDEQARSFFTYKIGRRSKKKEGDYYLYFKKYNVSPQVVNNFAFNEMVGYGVAHGIRFLQFQVEHSQDKETFLKYLKTAIPHRKSKYQKEYHEVLDYCLAWVNEQLELLTKPAKKTSNAKAKHNIVLVNNIQANNEVNAIVNSESITTTSSANTSVHQEIATIKALLETLQNNQRNQSGDSFNNEIKDCIERLERVDKGIGLFEFGKIETTGKDELKQFVFLLLALQSYNLNNNAKLPKFFFQLSKVDITRLLKLDFKY